MQAGGSEGASVNKNYISVAMIIICLAAASAIVFAQLQNNAGRTPRLTTEDVATASRPASGTPDATGQTAARRTIEPVQGAIAWHRSLGRALEAAKSENKVVVVDVYTDWCGWCKKMDQVIYADPLIVGLSRHEVFLKLDAEDGGEGEQFARRQGVTGYPTTIILDGQGRNLKVAKGFLQSPQRLLDVVESARAAR
jgi:thiol:disulfide interchange protein